MRRSLLAVLGIALALATMLPAGPVRADEYVIGAEDVLQVSVWLHPELERAVTVSTEGDITFPPLGGIKAAGLTPTQLGARLADRLSSYLRQTATVTVTVTQHLSQSVFVSGAVTHPGRYGFERLPGIVDVINQAGGATPGADLSQVQLIRREGDVRRPQTLDVARALREGTDAALPTLKVGDTIIVPGGLQNAAPTSGDVAGVLGEVGRPGLYPVAGGQSLWMVLAAAGGLTVKGNLADVRVVRPKDAGVSVFSVNLKDQLVRGSREPFVVRTGDVVFVNRIGGWSTVWAGMTQLLATSQNVANVVLIVDYFNHPRTTR